MAYTPSMSILPPPLVDEEEFGLPSYRQKPRPIGFDLAYKIEGDVLVIDSTRKIDRVRLASVEQVRFTFKPGNIASTGYVTELRLSDGKTITIGDISWRSMVEIERGGARYIRFIRELCAIIARLNPKARFVAGKPPVIWALFAVIATVSVLMMSYFAFRAWQQGVVGAVWIGVGLAAIAAWQMWPMVRLNRPRELALGEIPDDLMPKQGT